MLHISLSASTRFTLPSVLVNHPRARIDRTELDREVGWLAATELPLSSDALAVSTGGPLDRAGGGHPDRGCSEGGDQREATIGLRSITRQ
jgi:hypothetical protein